MTLLQKFPAERAAEFWRYTLGVLQPNYLGFLYSLDAEFLIRLAEQEVMRLTASSESTTPWLREDYRRLPTAIINTVEKFFRESAAAA